MQGRRSVVKGPMTPQQRCCLEAGTPIVSIVPLSQAVQKQPSLALLYFLKATSGKQRSFRTEAQVPAPPSRLLLSTKLRLEGCTVTSELLGVVASVAVTSCHFLWVLL